MGKHGQEPRSEGGHLLCFGMSPLNRGRMLTNYSILLKNRAASLAVPGKHKSPQCAEAWPMLSEPCSVLFSTLRGRESL